MRTLITLLLATTFLLACARKEESATFTAAERPAPLETKIIEERPARRLAYEHAVEVDTSEERLHELFTTVQTKCREFSADACEVLESRVSTGRVPYASLKLRLKPSGVQRIFALLSRGGTVVEQSTTAEDLAAPIADTQRRLALKTDYRSKLEALHQRAGNDIEALIKVNRELSEVQSEIEVLTGSNANLLRRVESEVVNISLHTGRNRSFMRPISDAFSDFGANLSQGIAATLTAIPYLLPWMLILAAAFWLARKLWTRRQRRSRRSSGLME